MIKTDESGHKEWDMTFGGSNHEWSYVRGSCQTIDGGCIMTGNTNSFGEGSYDIWMVKTDLSGNMIWNKTIGGKNSDLSWGMTSTGDIHTVCINKNFGSFSGTVDDIWIVGIDNEGNTQYSLLFEEEGVQVG